MLNLHFLSTPLQCSKCWKQDQMHKIKTEASLRAVLSKDHGLRPQDWFIQLSSLV